MKPSLLSKTQPSGKLLFLGDSITDDGRYLTFLNAWLRWFVPDTQTELYNLGVSSETVSGLSEAAHPFPRPCLHSRLQRALDTIQPDWVFLCYGMNDAIYAPYDAVRAQAFQSGYLRACERIRKSGAQCVVLTPPVFDAKSYAQAGGTLLGAQADTFSYLAAYEDYDNVLARYSAWLIDIFASPDASATLPPVHTVIDLHSATAKALQQRRAQNADCLHGDGIHPGLAGHWAMAKPVLETLFYADCARLEAFLAQDDFGCFQLLYERDSLLHHHWKERVGHDNETKSLSLCGEALAAALTRADAALVEHQRSFSVSLPD